MMEKSTLINVVVSTNFVSFDFLMNQTQYIFLAFLAFHGHVGDFVMYVLDSYFFAFEGT